MNDPNGASREPQCGGVTRRTAISGLMAAVLTPLLLDRAWGDARALQSSCDANLVLPLPREDHAVTPVGNGMLLVTGGFYLGPLASAQIFDPAGNAWHEAAPMLTPRYRHAAVVMGDGSVLVAGGVYLGTLTDAEIYDPAADAWQSVAPMLLPRSRHSGASYGGGALMWGGDYLGVLSAAEVFDGTQWQFV